MSFTNFTTTKRTHSVSNPDWLAVSSAVGRMVNAWSGRYDIAAFAGPGAGEGKPAFFNPYTSEVEVDATMLFGATITPDMIGKLDDRSVQFEWPRATGAIFHEACHARFSQWDIIAAQADLRRDEFQALILLEEGRIEFQGLKLFPNNAAFLRSMVLDVVANDASEVAGGSDINFAATAAALTLARVDSGSVMAEDVEPLRDAIVAKLGESTLLELTALWREAQAYDQHGNAHGLYDIARRWAKVVRDAAVAAGEPDPGEGAPGEGAPGAGGGEASEFMKDLLDAIGEAADMASISAYDAVADQETVEAWKESAAAAAAMTKDRVSQEKIASDVFGKGTTEMPVTSSASRLVNKRPATGTERAAAVELSRLLDKAKYRERDAHEVTSVTPPGRLRTRAAVQGAALRSKGLMSTTEPWRHTVRKHTEDATLTVGVMVDISGSMSGAMEPMAVTAWVLSEAIRRVQGKAAMVYYGNDVFPTLKPGQHLDQVSVYSAPDSTEKFGRAFAALNGQLNLLWGSGARLLVVVSDACYTSAESTAAKEALAACDRAGVGVLWLPFEDSGDYSVRSVCGGTSAVVQTIGRDTAQAAKLIGRAACSALAS